ncbi:MAG: serine--tRNA ligase [Bacteroidia bacterium]|nr:serine--tRNA ligase [Bacteroidia bacterium]
MLQLSTLRENTQQVIEKLAKKNFKNEAAIHEVIALDTARRTTQNEQEIILAQNNALAKQVGDLMKAGNKDEANALKETTLANKETSKQLGDKLADIELQIQNILYTIPNIPADAVPVGHTPEDNEIVRTAGAIPTLHAGAVPHWDLCKKYDLIDFELGVKITGAGFPVYKGKGAKLQRALINFFLDEATAQGYAEIQPPIFVNEASAYGTGNLPDKEGQMYHMQIDNLYCIPTAEVPVTNIYRDVILKESELPIKNTAYTPCFRREAGSYGKDVRGLNRLHQFDKVEIVQIAHPTNSYELHQQMVTYVESLLNKLELPYRVLKLCGGDMSFTSALTYDMEVFSAAQERWLEVSSISNFETFQANRLKCRYKDGEGKVQLVHTLNGSALALPRIVASLLENHQTENGIRIPQALVKYTGFEYIN